MRWAAVGVALAVALSGAPVARAQMTGPVAPRDGWWDLEHPCSAVVRYLLERVPNLANDYSPQLLAMERRGWAAMFPVVVAVADDPTVGEDADRLQDMTRHQVTGSLDGERLFYTGSSARDAWARVEVVLASARRAYAAGEPVRPAVLRLAAVLSDASVWDGYSQVGAWPSPEPECRFGR